MIQDRAQHLLNMDHQNPTRLFQDSLGTRNQHQEVFCVFLEVTRLCKEVGWSRNRVQFHTVQLELKSFLSMLVYAWTVFPFTLFGVWWLKYFIPYRIELMDPRESHGGTRRLLSSQTCITRSQLGTPASFQQTLIKFHQIQRIRVPMLFCVSDNTEAVIKMNIKDRNPPMGHFSRTNRAAFDWWFDRVSCFGFLTSFKYKSARYIDT